MPLRTMLDIRYVNPRSRERILEQPGEHALRVELILREPSGRDAVPLVVACDGPRARGCLLERAESEEALARRNRSREARVLDKRGLARGQVSDCAVAEPSVLGLDVDSLCDGELGTRSLYVRAKSERVTRHPPRIDELPAVFAQQSKIVLFGWMDVERDLESSRGPGRQLDELAELVGLGPVARALVLQRSKPPAPAGDGREPVMRAVRRDRPFGQHHRRPRRQPVGFAGRNWATWPADVLADREKHIVTVDGEHSLGIPDLREAWVDVDVGAPARQAQESLAAKVPADVH